MTDLFYQEKTNLPTTCTLHIPGGLLAYWGAVDPTNGYQWIGFIIKLPMFGGIKSDANLGGGNSNILHFYHYLGK